MQSASGQFSECTSVMSAWTPPTIITGNDRLATQSATAETTAETTSDTAADKDSWRLNQSADRLSLTRPDGTTLCLEFNVGKARHRVNEAGQGAQGLGRAMGISTFRKKHGLHPSVLDATGGLGQDAWAIASLGCHVTVLERHPVVHALLANALERAAQDETSQAIASRITLIEIDAITWFEQNNQSDTPLDPAQIIYLDPMYPARKQKAESKKGMQFLHALLGPPVTPESPQLLHGALAYQAGRVVVKRPKGAETLAGSEQWAGQRTSTQSGNTRYDIYHQSRKF